MEGRIQKFFIGFEIFIFLDRSSFIPQISIYKSALLAQTQPREGYIKKSEQKSHRCLISIVSETVDHTVK